MNPLPRALLLLSTLLIASCTTQTVPYVDIPRYMGLWYQIAAYETNFNEGLVGVTAEYTLQDDGSVQVYNKGFQGGLDGPIDEILGVATVEDPSSNARLNVRFPGVPNFPWANYLIVILDANNYQYAVVTDPLRYTMFILSRTPTMDPDLYDEILAELESRGFNINKLILTDQPSYQ